MSELQEYAHTSTFLTVMKCDSAGAHVKSELWIFSAPKDLTAVGQGEFYCELHAKTI